MDVRDSRSNCGVAAVKPADCRAVLTSCVPSLTVQDDGDEDLIAVTKSENSVHIFYAATGCDVDVEGGGGVGADARTAACCRLGQRWNGTACAACLATTYGTMDAAGKETAPSRWHSSFSSSVRMSTRR